MKRIVALILILCALLTVFCSCKKAEEPQSSVPVLSKPSSEPEPEPEPVKIYSPLTGLSGYNEQAVGKRPVAVMINNIAEALPQYGISKADIMFEIPVEGEITRMMALFSDHTAVPDVCSVRSCRYYYPIFAWGFDAVYIHWGIDMDYAAPVVYNSGQDCFDGDAESEPLFIRDPERVGNYAWEHTGCLKGGLLPEEMEKAEFRLTTDYGPAFKFNDEEAPVAPAGQLCHKAVFNFSSSYYSTFEYNEEEKLYYKQHSGSPHMDSATDTQLSFTNLLCLETDIGLKDDLYHRYVEWGGGNGYYVSNGAYMPITWEKASETDPIIIKDAASGQEISINAGKTYIGVIYPDKTEFIDLTPKAE